jgi:CMP-N-acetylneuraminic acid synthetase
MIGTKKVVGITLARGGSKSITKKNLVKIGGISLLERTIREVLDSKIVDLYLVSTDCQETKNVCAKYDKVVVIDRPKDLAKDTTSSFDSIYHALEEIDFDFNYVVEVMCTNPLKKSSDIDSCLKMLAEDNDADSVVSVSRIMDHHPSRVKYIEDGFLKDFYPEVKESRRQDLFPHAYVRNGAIYAFTKEAFYKYRSRYGGNVKAYIMEKSINIDEPIDLIVARKIMESE